MALSNAERQKRWRERMKGKLAQMQAVPERPNDDRDEMLALINAHYAAGMKAAALVDDSEPALTADKAASALPPLSWVDVLDLAEKAGQGAWSAAYERAAYEWVASLPKPLEMPPEPARRRRGRRG